MNPVNLELVKVNRQWKKILTSYPDVLMYTCLGEKHEVQLFDGLMKSKLEENTNDETIYLIQYQNFSSKSNYGQSFFDDWSEYYNLWQKTQNDIPSWEIKFFDNSRTDAYKALFPLLDLKNNFPHLKDVMFFIYIAPLQIDSFNEFSIWINDWCRICEKNKIDNIKLVWSEHHTHSILSKNKWEHRFRINVDIHQLMQNTAAYTNKEKNSPETDFQQLIITASNYLSKNKFTQAESSLKNAIKLALKIKNREGEILSYFMLTQIYNVKGRKNEIKETYNKIFDRVEKKSNLEVQMYMNYGSYLLTISKKDKAENAFNKAAEIAQTIENYTIAMECYRILGSINDSLLNSDTKVIQYYEEALNISKNISNELLEQTNIKIIASLLMKKYDEKGEKSIALNDKMNKLFGELWKVNIEPPKDITKKLKN